MVDMSAREDQPLGLLLVRVAAALRNEVIAGVLEPLDLSFPQYICMRILSHSPGKSNAELARDANVSPQAMNMVLRGLQDRGLVTRPAAVASGRSLPAELTRDGVALLVDVDPGVQDAERKVLAPLSEQDRRHFRRLLAELG
ncbi:MarR family transcriptional regulator [Mycobacterium hodleri]|uniref:MarR family winged helix-turn-helix transcriptional regulator n=1 Tax=Mycolicibacterium hodleri TaxID=49897 RepID=UPI0021F339B1|nr:MarR family transcriptional regulator [Mycolicibacterium hodleri]MCV7132770.1 MarR family transcriptional regulator [Mycolicibacterium hodleri]